MNNTFKKFETACNDAYLFMNQYHFLPAELLAEIKLAALDVDPQEVEEKHLGLSFGLFLLNAHPELIHKANVHWLITENVLQHYEYVSEKTMSLICSKIDFMDDHPINFSNNLPFGIMSALERGFIDSQTFHPAFKRTAPFLHTLPIKKQAFGLAVTLNYHKNMDHIVFQDEQQALKIINCVHKLNLQKKQPTWWSYNVQSIHKLYDYISFLPFISEKDSFLISLLSMQMTGRTPPYLIKHEKLTQEISQLQVTKAKDLQDAIFNFYTSHYDPLCTFVDFSDKHMLFHAWQEINGFKPLSKEAHSETPLML